MNTASLHPDLDPLHDLLHFAYRDLGPNPHKADLEATGMVVGDQLAFCQYGETAPAVAASDTANCIMCAVGSCTQAAKVPFAMVRSAAGTRFMWMNARRLANHWKDQHPAAVHMARLADRLEAKHSNDPRMEQLP